MSRDFMEDYLQHSWGKKPEQKAREKQYNKEYYQKHKDKWKNLNDDKWDKDIWRDVSKFHEKSKKEDLAGDEKYHSSLESTRRTDEARSNINKINTNLSAYKGAGVLTDLGNVVLNAELRRNRQKMISSGAAANEAAKSASKNKRNAKRYEEKATAYVKNQTKDSFKRQRSKKVKETIDAGKKFVSNLLDKIF